MWLVLIFFFQWVDQDQYLLELKVTGLEEPKGKLMIAIYDNNIDFPGDNAFLLRKINIETIEDQRTTFYLPTGTFAISIFHDINGDEKLNTNFIGIPKEPYGFSNAKGTFGPPSFEKASFIMPGSSSLEVALE